MHGAEPEPEPVQGDVVFQIKLNVTHVRCGGPGSDTCRERRQLRLQQVL